MARPPNPYTKLPGRGLRKTTFAVSATRCRLWLAADHLLSVDFTIASEEYRRFYFRDIEAFVVRRTAQRQIWNWVLLGLALVTAGPLLALFISEQKSGAAWSFTADNGGLLIAAGIVLAFWALLILINTLRGPTCRVHVRTAVQCEPLFSLGRLSTARKVLARIRPLIAAAQGAATPEEFAAAPWIAARSTLAADGTPIRRAHAPLHISVFGLLLLDAVLTGILFAITHRALTAPGMLAALAGFLACIVALMRMGGTDLPAGLRTLTKLALGYYILESIVGFVFTVIYSVQHPGKTVITGLEIVDVPGFTAVALGAAVLAGILGGIGGAQAVSFFRQRAARGPA